MTRPRSNVCRLNPSVVNDFTVLLPVVVNSAGMKLVRPNFAAIHGIALLVERYMANQK